jgi:hypothetical protein
MHRVRPSVGVAGRRAPGIQRPCRCTCVRASDRSSGDSGSDRRPATVFRHRADAAAYAEATIASAERLYARGIALGVDREAALRVLPTVKLLERCLRLESYTPLPRPRSLSRGLLLPLPLRRPIPLKRPLHPGPQAAAAAAETTHPDGLR